MQTAAKETGMLVPESGASFRRRAGSAVEPGGNRFAVDGYCVDA